MSSPSIRMWNVLKPQQRRGLEAIYSATFSNLLAKPQIIQALRVQEVQLWPGTACIGYCALYRDEETFACR